MSRTAIWARTQLEHRLKRLGGRGARYECTRCGEVVALRNKYSAKPRAVHRVGGRWITEYVPCSEVCSELILLQRIIKKLALIIELARPTPFGEWFRAGGDVICEACGFEYWRHICDPCDPFLHILCDGSRVKL